MRGAPIHPGDRNRDVNLAIVSARRGADIDHHQYVMLSAMLARDSRQGSSDDISSAGINHKSNAPAIGAAVRMLSMAKLIVRVGYIKSDRPSRHGNEIKLWKIADEQRAVAERDRLARINSLTKESAPDASGAE